MDARIEELIHAELDGALGAGEKAELEAAVAASPEAARLRQALAGLQAVFSAEEPVDPPASLAEAITRSITLPQPAAAAPEPRNGPSSNFIKTGSVEPILFQREQDNGALKWQEVAGAWRLQRSGGGSAGDGSAEFFGR